MAVEPVVTPRANLDIGIELLVWNGAHVVCTCVAKHSSTCPVKGEIVGKGKGERRVRELDTCFYRHTQLITQELFSHTT